MSGLPDTGSPSAPERNAPSNCRISFDLSEVRESVARLEKLLPVEILEHVFQPSSDDIDSLLCPKADWHFSISPVLAFSIASCSFSIVPTVRGYFLNLLSNISVILIALNITVIVLSTIE